MTFLVNPRKVEEASVKAQKGKQHSTLVVTRLTIVVCLAALAEIITLNSPVLNHQSSGISTGIPHCTGTGYEPHSAKSFWSLVIEDRIVERIKTKVEDNSFFDLYS
ncbi:hypothetical protein KY289_030028 [Solanum tuberosum]|nr:hypothetical protein KY289_030028 [Solanum tuberosum]